MSNQSIIESLESNLKEKNTETLSLILEQHIEALEGIPYQRIEEMREFRHRIEISGFAEEEECISDLPKVLSDLTEWISTLKQEMSITSPSSATFGELEIEICWRESRRF